MTEELKRFEQWWDAGDDIPNDGPYTPDTPIQFSWAGWQAALAQPEQEPFQPDWANFEEGRKVGRAEALEYPPNCGTGHCSCIECFKLVK